MSISLWETFENTAKKFGNRAALVFQGTVFTYAELLALVERLAAALERLGIRKQDRAVIYQSHCPQWIIAWLALQRLGAVAVPVTHFYGSRELKYIVMDSGAEYLFCMDANLAEASEVARECKLRYIIVTNAFEFLPPWKELIDQTVANCFSRRIAATGGAVAFGDMIKAGPLSAAERPSLRGEDLAEILYTSGTTGLPKGVPLSHAVFLQAAREQRAASEPLIPIGQDIVLQGSPLYHILGQNIGLGALLAGDTLILLPQMDIEAVLQHIDRYKVTTLFGTPTFFRMILEHPEADNYNLGSLKWCYTGGDYLPPPLIERFRQRFGKYIYQGYGATEASGGIAVTPATGETPEGSVGKVLPVWQVKLVDPDTLEPVPPPGPGELLISSEYMVTYYWNKPEETADRFVRLEGRLWYRTGDIMLVDQDGWVFFVDRSADIIKHKGYRVAPSKIERVLTDHPGVAAACAVGIPDEEVGEKIKALVIPQKDPSLPVTAEELLSWCRERLAPYEVPHWIEFREILPTSATGKILRRLVRSQERQVACTAGEAKANCGAGFHKAG